MCPGPGSGNQGRAELELDLIVCDEEIDDSQGASLVSELQQIPERQDVPIMYMSVRQLPDVISRPHNGGAAYHIKKPLDPGSLLEKINQALYELPLINQQVSGKIGRPHFPITAIATIPNVSAWADH